jgi:hypothetical protein
VVIGLYHQNDAMSTASDCSAAAAVRLASGCPISFRSSNACQTNVTTPKIAVSATSELHETPKS